MAEEYCHWQVTLLPFLLRLSFGLAVHIKHDIAFHRNNGTSIARQARQNAHVPKFASCFAKIPYSRPITSEHGGFLKSGWPKKGIFRSCGGEYIRPFMLVPLFLWDQPTAMGGPGRDSEVERHGMKRIHCRHFGVAVYFFPCRQVYDGNLCVGTDPNRNWDFHWNEGGSSANSCSDS